MSREPGAVRRFDHRLIHDFHSYPTSYFAAGALAFTASQVQAGPPDVPLTPAAEVSPWEFRLEPYFWATGITGETGVLFREVPTDLGFKQVFQHLKMALPVQMELRYNRFGLLTDIIYADIGGYIDAPRIQQLALDDKMLIFQFVPNYRIFKSEKGFLDFLAGLRGWDMTLRVTGFRQPGIVTSGGYFKESQTRTWVDGIAGMRGQYFLFGNTFIAAYGDIGGGSSKLTWQVQATMGYKFSPRTSAEFGWRVLSDNYADGGFTYNVKQQGIYSGVSFTW